MGIDKLKKSLFGTEDKDDDNIDEEVYRQPGTMAFKESTADSSKMILFEPRAYSESQQIANYLKNNNAVIVNLKRVTPDQAKRIVDFLSGTLYAIDGGLEKLGGGIFLCTPNNVPVEGKITDDSQLKNVKKPKQEKDDEIDW